MCTKVEFENSSHFEEAVNILKDKVSELIKKTFGIDYQPELKVSSNTDFGDISFECFVLAKKLKTNPNQVAKSLAESDFGSMVKTNAIGPYLNFKLNIRDLAKQTFTDVEKQGKNYGKAEKNGQKAIVEFVSSNPIHPLHIGHFRNGCYGDSLANILEAVGYDVERHFYINDEGNQVAILAHMWKKLGCVLSKDEKPDHFIGKIYVEANKVADNPEERIEIDRLLSFMENKEPETIKLFNSIVNPCLKGQIETLKRIGIRFNYFLKESALSHTNKVNLVINKLATKPECKKLNETQYYQELLASSEINESDGKRKILDLSEYGIDKPLFLTRVDGTSLYTTRDIAYSIWKLERNSHKIFNVIATEQNLPQKQMKKALELLGYKNIENTLIHAAYEIVLTPEFGSMSGRKGEYISLDELLDKVNNVVLKHLDDHDISIEDKPKITEDITQSIKFHMLKVDPTKILTFKMNDALDTKGNSGAYIQYTAVRAKSISDKIDIQEVTPSYDALSDVYSTTCVKLLAQYPSTVKEAAHLLSPAIICRYLIDLADAFNNFYENTHVMNSPTKEIQKARLLLVKSTLQVLTNGLGLLGIPVPERM